LKFETAVRATYLFFTPFDTKPTKVKNRVDPVHQMIGWNPFIKIELIE